MNRTATFKTTIDGRDRHGPGDYIPTEGYPTSAMEMYRVIEVIRTGHEGWNSCFMDSYTATCLSNFIEGKISTWAEIEAAEKALQGLLLYDRIDFLIPSFKSIHGGHESYTRCKTNRSQLCFDLFQPCTPYDILYPTEKISFQNGVAISGSSPASKAFGASIDQIKEKYFSYSVDQQTLFASLPLKMSVPGWFSHPSIARQQNHINNLFAILHEKLAKNWKDIPRIVPRLEKEILLPPFLSIVGDRVASREQIPDALREIRQELAPIRQELLEFESIIEESKETNPAEVEKMSLYISESFDNIYKASKAKTHPLSFLIALYNTVKTPFDGLLSILNPEYNGSPSIVASRTMTGLHFSRALKDMYAAGIGKKLLTHAEISALQADKGF